MKRATGNVGCRGAIGAMAIVWTLGVSACAPVATAPQVEQAGSRRVFFVEPQDGAVVSAPLAVKMGAERFTVEAAGERHDNAGHLHIMVDVPCIDPGAAVPKDEAHLHFGQGQLEASLDLSPGRHTLCLQAADGNHIALAGDGMTQIIDVTIE